MGWEEGGNGENWMDLRNPKKETGETDEKLKEENTTWCIKQFTDGVETRMFCKEKKE